MWTGPAAPSSLRSVPRRDVRFPAAAVKSISTSGHKFGLAPLGVGWVVWRASPNSPRTWCSMSTTWAVTCRPSRSTSPARRANHRPVLQLPPPRLRRVQEHPRGVLRDRPVPSHRDRQGRPLRALIRPQSRHRDPDRHLADPRRCGPGYTLFDLADRLRTRGWQDPPTPSPGQLPRSPCSDPGPPGREPRHGVSAAGRLLEAWLASPSIR